MADSSKTEKATPKKRRDERKKGNVFKSQDVVSVVTLIGACCVFFALASYIAEETAKFMSLCIELCSENTDIQQRFGSLFQESILLVLKTGMPGLLVTALCAVVATFAQTRMLISGELMKPKFSRINPLEGFKRLFSLKSLIEALKGILKITILMIMIYLSLKDVLLESSKYLYNDIAVACAYLFQHGRTMVIRIIIAFIALAAGTFFYEWWSFERDMRMSKEEIKEEYKQTEGDPKVKGKIKEIQRSRAQRRMMQQVPQADVVIRNPTHFAVALRYKPETDNAPIVLAKGQDELALRIVKTAEDAGVAVMENVSLARALYAQADLEREIPPDLYGAVAEVLVYVFKLNQEKKLIK